MKNLKQILTLSFSILAGQLFGQVDPHFSQYYAYPIWLNPALTGSIDGNLRITANYKNQWANIDNGYITEAISVECRLSEKIGIGINSIKQKAGNAGYQYLTINGSISYGIALADDNLQMLNFGMQAGVVNQGIDPAKFQLGSQYNPGLGFDPSLPSNERLLAVNSTTPDASAGMYYHNEDEGKAMNFFAGGSVSHLIHSKNIYSADGKDVGPPLRYSFHAGLRIRTQGLFDFIPQALYIRQQKNDIRIIGVSAEFKSIHTNSLLMGLMYRMNDAVIIHAGFHLNDVTAGVSYDFTTSGLDRVTVARGGPELSLSYTFGRNDRVPICPRF